MRLMAARRTVELIAEILRPSAGGEAASLRRRAVADWTAPLAFANEHLLGPALYAALASAERLDDLPADVCDYLALMYRSNGERNLALRRQIIEAVTALNSADVVPMLLKGGLGLFTDLHADPAARMIRDIDLVVPPADLDRAVDTLYRLGYRLIARYEAGHNAYGDFARPHDPGAVDLHLELIETPYLLRAAEVWKRAAPRHVAEGAMFLAPARADIALHHLLHAQIHYVGNFYRGILELRQLYDFATLIDHWRDIDWAAIHRHLVRHRLGLALESYALASRRLFGSRWPLEQPPSMGADLHCRRCLLQLRWPILARLGVPLANLRAAFAMHRMNGLYGQVRSPIVRRLRHVSQYMRKKAPRDAIGRLFRAH